MNVKFLNPFVESAFEVIRAETGCEMSRGELRLQKEPYQTEVITVIISLIGGVEGNVFYSMSSETGRYLAGQILGEPVNTFDMLAQSGIAELGNVITGRASIKLSQAGFESTISPPALLLGKGATISTLDYVRLTVPMTGECGTLVIHLALREGKVKNFNTARVPVATTNI
jgi:chemotaxis protein CheX